MTNASGIYDGEATGIRGLRDATFFFLMVSGDAEFFFSFFHAGHEGSPGFILTV